MKPNHIRIQNLVQMIHIITFSVRNTSVWYGGQCDSAWQSGLNPRPPQSELVFYAMFQTY